MVKSEEDKCPEMYTIVSDKTTYATVCTQIRLFLKKQSDKGLHSLPFL